MARGTRELHLSEQGGRGERGRGGGGGEVGREGGRGEEGTETLGVHRESAREYQETHRAGDDVPSFRHVELF